MWAAAWNSTCGARDDDIGDAVVVADVREHELGRLVEVGGRVVQVGLVVVEEDEPLRSQGGDLAGDLRADQAAGPV